MKIDNPPSPSANGANHVANAPAKVEASTSTTHTKSVPAAWQIVMLPIDQIGPNPYQPRLQFDEGEMAELISSVRERGVQQPILVRTTPKPSTISKNDGSGESTPRYQLVAGERRLRACKAAKTANYSSDSAR